MTERVYRDVGQIGMMRRYYDLVGIDEPTMRPGLQTNNDDSTMRIATLLALLILAIGNTGCSRSSAWIWD